MKVKYLWASLIALTFFSCDDSTDSLGLNMMPDSDKITVGGDTYDITTETVVAGSVFAKSSMGYLGKYTDPEFGLIEADFLTQLTCTEQFAFPLDRMVPTNKAAENKEYNAEGATINLYYSSYFGNPTSANRLSIYQLDKDLTKDNFTNYYTNINPTDYYNDASQPLQKAYSAVDLSVSESIRNAATYYPSISVKFPLEKANEIIKLYQTCKANKTSFRDAFSKAFKGIYVKCDHGNGTILYIDQVNLSISFRVYAMQADGVTPLKKKEKGHESEDSTYVTAAQFGATKEIVQANRFKNDLTLNELAKIKDYTMIKSPAGLFTKVNLPLNTLIKEMEKVGATKVRKLNTVRIAFDGYNKNTDNKFGMSTPTTLMLIRTKDVKDFFEKNMLPDEKTSFLSSREAKVPNKYSFSNISNLVYATITELKDLTPERVALNAERVALNVERVKPGADVAAVDAKIKVVDAKIKVVDDKIKALDEFVLIPVVVDTDKSQNNNLVSVRHDLRPGYLKLKGGNTPLKMEVIYSTLKK